MKNNITTMFLTMLIAFLGGGLADIFNLSGAYLIGSMVFIFFSGLLKIKLFLPKFFRNLALGFAGLTIGHSITNETLNLLYILPKTIFLMIFSTIIFIFLSSFIIKIICKTETLISLISIWPGNLLLILEILERREINKKFVSFIQSFRIFTLFLLIPSIVSLFSHQNVIKNINYSYDLLYAIIITSICILISRKIKFLGGEMIITAFIIGTLNSANLLEFTIPTLLNNFFQIILGSFIAIEILKCDRKFLFHALKPSIFISLFAVAYTLFIAYIASLIIDYSFPALALSFAPGGAEAMIIISYIFSVDPSFVGIHHTVRLLILTLFLPFIVDMFKNR